MMAKDKITTRKDYQARLKVKYNDEITLQLKEELKLSNVHQVPKLQKIVVNVGLGKAADDKKILEVANNTLRKITGQQPVKTKAKKSIASFKLRAGSTIGLAATLRDQRMYEFADRLINLVLPRLRDFRGVKSSSFDEAGNYSIGFTDQSVFPELSYDETSTPHGIQITFTISPSSKENSKLLLQKLGLPFDDKKGGQNG